MRYLTLDELKRQLVINSDWHDDDEYIESLGATAEDYIEQHIDKQLDEVTFENDGVFPMPLRQACRMIVEWFYSNRGSDDQNKIPGVIDHICKLYRQF